MTPVTSTGGSGGRVLDSGGIGDESRDFGVRDGSGFRRRRSRYDGEAVATGGGEEWRRLVAERSGDWWRRGVATSCGKSLVERDRDEKRMRSP